MGHFLERLRYFKHPREPFADGFGELRTEARQWEDGYRNRWAHDKEVRSTHGVNCTGSCSWKIHVKQGVVTWEMQATDYPRTRANMPNHEPRGCPRGASYSWYLYSANRMKHPMVRGRLLRRWRELRATLRPVAAWAKLMQEPGGRDYKQVRGLGGFVRASWDEAVEMIAAANIHTIRTYGPDRVAGFTPIPAMSMVSYASGTRYLALLGGTILSFYDWYCDLPAASPQTWGEQTDVPTSEAWYDSSYLIAWGSNVPQTRSPDAHFFTEARYNGAYTVAISPDYSEASKLSDLWIHPKQGTDCALAMAMVHVILKEFFIDRQVTYFIDYCRRFTDLPLLIRLRRDGDRWVPSRFVRASDFEGALGTPERAEWKTVGYDGDWNPVAPRGSIGFRWAGADSADRGRWNLEQKTADGRDIELQLSAIDRHDEVLDVAFPYFGGVVSEHFPNNDQQGDVLVRKAPVRKLATRDGEVRVATVFDLMCAHYGVDRGLGGVSAKGYDDNVPYTPAWQEQITGTPALRVIEIARGFATNAEKTQGRSMVIIGSGMNHWFHQDVAYRAVIAMLMLCGTVGQSGGGWAHYTGQECIRPEVGWATLAFALDWVRPPRHMAGTLFFYTHSDQWRYETVDAGELLSPLAEPGHHSGTIIDHAVRAQRMGWMPGAPQLNRNPLDVAREATTSGDDPTRHVVAELKSGRLTLASEDPDNPANFPRNMFIWRSNLLGSSGKGHEYFLKHFLGTQSGIQGKDLGEEGRDKPEEVKWHDPAPEGKLDLVVTSDFRMSTTALYSDIVLPTASWYEKNDLSTTDMHPFIHPFTAAIDPVWESRSDWDTFRMIAKKFSAMAADEGLGVAKDVVLSPIMHDTPKELAQPFEVRDWKKGECDLVPGVTGPSITFVDRDYQAVYARYTALGPLVETKGVEGKGVEWNAAPEADELGRLNGTVEDGPAKGRPRIHSDIDATEMILMISPETNGEVAVRGWDSVSEQTGRSHRHLAETRQGEKFRYRDLQAQPKRVLVSPIWSGVDTNEDGIDYSGYYTNVHELIPWRTLTGRQHFYIDHPWFRDFGESFTIYRPPLNTRTLRGMDRIKGNGHPGVVLNFITPHQKWGIHSTYTDNLIMLTLSRGGPIVWISEVDARKAGIVDNDWIECFNANGSLTARAVVSQRVNEGMAMMYHAQEKIVNVPGSEITHQRGGIHNSVTRIVLKPTQMAGGAAQFSWTLNYYGPVGSDRDNFVVVRKMEKIDWMDRVQRAARERELGTTLVEARK